MLRAADVSYAYVPGAPVLRHVSASVGRGELLGLLGPNGCGKTTLLRLLAGITRPQQGTIALDGRPLASYSRRAVARRIAFVPQETQPAFQYTALELVLMGRHPHLDAFALEGPRDIAIAREALAATGTAHMERRPLQTLSGGEKQRVMIASALAQSPDLLLLDEPTASLDLGYQLEIASLLARLNRERGVTIVMATHDLNLAAAICTELVLLRRGEVVTSGLTADVLTPASIRQVYDVEADVHLHAEVGHLTVVPIRRSAAPAE